MASYKLAEKCGFELFEKRTPISYKQSNMEGESYFYYRKYRYKLTRIFLEFIKIIIYS